MKLIFIHLIALVASISGNNRANRVVSLQQIQNRCLTHQNTAPKDKSCTTQLGVKMQMANVEDGVFFCLSYKKSPGDAYNAFDIIRINLHPDYDLQYGGANVIDYEMPTFKIYQGPEYNSRFALFSNNSDFRIYEVTINEVPQSCSFGKRGNRMWPHGNKTQVSEPENEGNGNDQIEANQFQPPSMPTFPERRETSTVNLVEDRREPTTIKPARHSPNTLPSQSNDAKNPSCGMVQKTIDLTHFSMPSNPGQFPFVASIHQVIDDDENNSAFKCSGSIIDQSVIITSVNCLMDSGARLLSENEIQVHVGQYSKNAKSPPSKIYEVEKIMPHEQFNFKLDNNVAALKLKRKIEFDDFIQPVCMPDKNTNIAEGANGKVSLQFHVNQLELNNIQL